MILGIHDFRDHCEAQKNVLTFMNYNIRNFHRNCDQMFALFGNSIYPDVITLSQTWFKEENTVNLNDFLTTNLQVISISLAEFQYTLSQNFILVG